LRNTDHLNRDSGSEIPIDVKETQDDNEENSSHPIKELFTSGGSKSF
jgi:hypothetical protein